MIWAGDQGGVLEGVPVSQEVPMSAIVQQALAADLYERDFYAWTLDQAEALRAGRLATLDVKNLAEEIEDLGKEQFSKLESALRVLLLHMLKWDHQPERRSRSWANSIGTQRLHIGYLLKDNPGLKSRREEAVARAFSLAVRRASTEMKRDLARLPAICPYGLDEIMTRAFEWPQR